MCTKSTLLLGNGKSFSPTILPFNPYVSFMEWEKKGQIFMFNLEIDIYCCWAKAILGPNTWEMSRIQDVTPELKMRTCGNFVLGKHFSIKISAPEPHIQT